MRANDGEPVLLVFDHLDSKMLLYSHKIILFVLPPHSSALTQPLDLSVNGEFKRAMGKRFVNVPMVRIDETD